MIEHLLIIAAFFIGASAVAEDIPEPTAQVDVTKSAGHQLNLNLDDWRCYCGKKLKRFQTCYEGEKPFITLPAVGWEVERTTFKRGHFATLQFICKADHTTALMLGPEVP